MEQQELRKIAERTIETFREYIAENGVLPKDVEAYLNRCANLYINYAVIDRIVTSTGLKKRIVDQYPHWEVLVEQARNLTLFPQFLEMQKDENSPAYESWGTMIAEFSRLFGTKIVEDGMAEVVPEIIDALLGNYPLDFGVYGTDDEIDGYLSMSLAEFEEDVETKQAWDFGTEVDLAAMETYLGRGSGGYMLPFAKDDYRTMAELLNSCLADGKEAEKEKLADWLERILNDLEGVEFTPLGINHAAAFHYAAHEETEAEWYRQFKPVTNSFIEVPEYRSDKRFREFIPPYHVTSILSDIGIIVKDQFGKTPVPFAALGNLILNRIKAEDIRIKDTELREYETYKAFVVEVLKPFGKGPFDEAVVEEILSHLAVCMVRPYVENFKHDAAENLLWTRNVQAYSEWVKSEDRYLEGGEYAWLVFAQEKPFMRIAKLPEFMEGADIDEGAVEVRKVSWKQNLYSLTNLVGSVLDTLNKINDDFYPTDLYHHREQKFTGYDQPNGEADMNSLPEHIYIVSPLKVATEESLLVIVARSLAIQYPMDLNFTEDKYEKKYLQPMDAELRQLEGELARCGSYLKRRNKAEAAGKIEVSEDDRLRLIREVADINKHLADIERQKAVYDENPHKWAEEYLDRLNRELAEVTDYLERAEELLNDFSDEDRKIIKRGIEHSQRRQWILRQAIASTEKAVKENFKMDAYKNYKKAPKAKFYPDVLVRTPYFPKIVTL